MNAAHWKAAAAGKMRLDFTRYIDGLIRTHGAWTGRGFPVGHRADDFDLGGFCDGLTGLLTALQ